MGEYEAFERAVEEEHQEGRAVRWGPRKVRRGRKSGLFHCRNAERLTRENLVQRSEFLPAIPRTLVRAYFELGMSVEELASLHAVRARQMRYRLDHLYNLLCDPSFLLAAHFGHRLPSALATVSRAYWIEGRTLREVAAAQHTTLHRVRSQIKAAKSLLVVAMAGEQDISPEMAGRVLN